ncbi:hypothetical protein PROVALCAL_03117 [Providencia alcalifaciens DSM 30120]|uniref:Uncharacterized protein n=1 Tax=Providencia alcalifaciens DSM 30120 TaxID=520999 RepID=B6XIC8_9GAMM|nr:hypothetical protein PROVALCAL_03117 [Providencia alcalifaciens DSM 30120]
MLVIFSAIKMVNAILLSQLMINKCLSCALIMNNSNAGFIPSRSCNGTIHY